MRLGEYIIHDITHFDLSTSGILVVLSSFLRNSILFFTFAWKYNMDERTFYTSSTIFTLTLLFLGFTLAFADPPLATLVIYSMIMTLLQYASYMCVRRRDIRRAPTRERYRGE